MPEAAEPQHESVATEAGPAAAPEMVRPPAGPVGLLAISAGAGNLAVGRMLARTTLRSPGPAILARGKGERPKDALEPNPKNMANRLAEDQNSAWFGSPSSPKLVLKRSAPEGAGVM